MHASLERHLAAVLAAPHDEAPRRAFAEAVRSTVPKRAEFIDCQLAIRQARRAGQEIPAPLADRAKLIASLEGYDWAHAIRPLVKGLTYFGGFVEHVEVAAQHLHAAGTVLPTLAPIRHLRLHDLHGKVQTLLALPPAFLRALVSLDLRKNRLDDAEVIAIVTCPDLVNLEVLDLAFNPISEFALRAIKLAALRFVDTAWTSAVLVEQWDDWGGVLSVHFTSLHTSLVRDLGPVAWLQEFEGPHLDTLVGPSPVTPEVARPSPDGELVEGMIEAFFRWDEPDRVAAREALADEKERQQVLLLQQAWIRSGQRGSEPLDVTIHQMTGHFAGRIEAEAPTTGPLPRFHQPLPELENGGYVVLEFLSLGEGSRALELRVESASGERKAAEVVLGGTNAEIVRFLRSTLVAATVIPLIEKLTAATAAGAVT